MGEFSKKISAIGWHYRSILIRHRVGETDFVLFSLDKLETCKLWKALSSQVTDHPSFLFQGQAFLTVGFSYFLEIVVCCSCRFKQPYWVVGFSCETTLSPWNRVGSLSYFPAAGWSRWRCIVLKFLFTGPRVLTNSEICRFRFRIGILELSRVMLRIL